VTNSEQEMIEKLADVVEDLEGFEHQFVSDMIKRPSGYQLSDKQVDTLERIHAKHCVGD
jgi:hypothetical protein